MLGHLDTGEAVALIPRGLGGYWYFDPVTNEKAKVSADVASHIQKDAVFFYRPFPSRPFAEGNKTQKHIADSLASLKCTRVVIAHRLSTVRECDRIMVVAGGSIAEEGTYEELIEKGGIFAELVERQRIDDEL